MDYKGIPITIEFKRGSFKPDKNSSLMGSGWYIYADYGFIKDTKSQEPGEELDVFVGDIDSDLVHMAYLEDKDGSPIEVKVLVGFASVDDAMSLMTNQYYCPNPQIVSMSVEDFKTVLEEGKMAALKDKSWVKTAPQAQPGKTDIEIQKSMKDPSVGLMVYLD